MQPVEEIGMPDDTTWWWCGVFSKEEMMGWYETIRADLGLPADADRYRLREALKRQGRAVMNDETLPMDGRVRGYVSVLLAHCLRSWEASEFSPLHPRITDYIRMCATPRGVVPDTVWAAFVAEHRPKASPFMVGGRSYFEIGQALDALLEAMPAMPMDGALKEMGAFGMVQVKRDGRQRYLPVIGIVGDVVSCVSWCGRYRFGFGLHDMRMAGMVWRLPTLPCVRVDQYGSKLTTAEPWLFDEIEIVQRADLVNDAGERAYSFIPPAGSPASQCYKEAAWMGFPYGDAPGLTVLH